MALLEVVVLAACNAERKPTRSECIAGFRMDWSEVKTPREDVNNAIAGTTPWGPQKALHGIDPLVGMALPYRNRNEIYLQFSRECDKKWEMAERLLDIWRSWSLDLPKFERMTDPIVPSPDTIDQRGAHWRD